MFESHPLTLAIPSHLSHTKIPSTASSGPFLLEKNTFPSREPKLARKEWPIDCHMRYLAFLQICGVECG